MEGPKTLGHRVANVLGFLPKTALSLSLGINTSCEQRTWGSCTQRQLHAVPTALHSCSPEGSVDRSKTPWPGDISNLQAELN